MSAAFGQQIKQETIDGLLLTGPGEDLVPKTLLQMSSIKGFVGIFGPYVPKSDQQRWADYQKSDWTIRQLPAINIFENAMEDKTSDNAWLNGTITFQIFWPPSFRRGDMRRVEVAFKGAMQNFFSSKSVSDMLDELYWHQRPMKVDGLNEYGKVINWSPNAEGVVATELVPVTVLDVRYRIDLRAYYRSLEFNGRTKDNPFEKTLADLTTIGSADSGYEGTPNNDGTDVQVFIPDEITVSNP